MKHGVVWTLTAWELFKELPEREREREATLEKLSLLEFFPNMYPVRIKGRRFRRHRWFGTRDWLVYYRVIDNTVYVRGLWPARIP